MFSEILTLLLKIDAPKPQEIKSPWGYIPITKRETVVNFCKKYPWAVDQEFLKDNKLDIISPKKCPIIESHMMKTSWIPLYSELSKPLQNEYYPTNYWERLAVLACLDLAAQHIFLDVMLKHGFRFTEGVCERLLITCQLETVTKRVIMLKIKRDREEMLLELA